MRQYMDVAREVDLTKWLARSLGEPMDEWQALVWQYWM